MRTTYKLELPRWAVLTGATAAAALVLTTSQIGAAPAEAATVTATCAASAANDLTTLNTAIASSKAGDTVLIKGRCILSGQLVLKQDRTYTGEHRADDGTIDGVATKAGSTIEQAAGTSYAGLLVSEGYATNKTESDLPVQVRNLTLRGNGNANTSGIIMRSWMSTIDNLYITGFGKDGIRLSNPSANGTVLTNTMVNGKISNSMIEASKRYGVYVQDPGNSITDWQLVDNWIAGDGKGVDGIHLENSAGWMIERNHTYGSAKNGIYADRLWGTSITDNYVEDFGTTTTVGTYYGIFGSLQGDDSASTITGNRVHNFGGASTSGSTYKFIGVEGNYDATVIAVTGNTVRGPVGTPKPGTIGLDYQKAGATSLTVASTGNAVANVATPKVVGTGVTASAGQ